MRSFIRIAFAASVLVTCLVPDPAQADIGVVKPDLRILSIAPSPLGSHYARVKIVNAGFAASKSCLLSVSVYTPLPVTLYYPVPAIGPTVLFNSPTATVDVYLGVPLNQCGLKTTGYVDVLQQVAETKETNNGFTYLAPPC